MRQLPSRTVTLLFTDIEGSTRLLHELGERYADVLAEHRRVVREAFSRYGGVEVDTQGDAFFVAFARASDAVAAAREAQDALADGPVRVRIGIHTGEPVVTEEGYVGTDVHRAASGARLESILASHALAHAAEGRLYQGALLQGAESRGLEPVAIPKQSIWEQGESALGVARDELRHWIEQLRREIGPPWAQDQKLAALAAWIALARSS